MTIPIVPNAFGFDRALAAMFCRARAGETVSTQAGRAQAAGKRWGCILCAILDVVVERGHCALAISIDGHTRGAAAIRAGLALFLGVALPFSLACWAAWALLFWLVRLVF